MGKSAALRLNSTEGFQGKHVRGALRNLLGKPQEIGEVAMRVVRQAYQVVRLLEGRGAGKANIL